MDRRTNVTTCRERFNTLTASLKCDWGVSNMTRPRPRRTTHIPLSRHSGIMVSTSKIQFTDKEYLKPEPQCSHPCLTPSLKRTMKRFSTDTPYSGMCSCACIESLICCRMQCFDRSGSHKRMITTTIKSRPQSLLGLLYGDSDVVPCGIGHVVWMVCGEQNTYREAGVNANDEINVRPWVACMRMHRGVKKM